MGGDEAFAALVHSLRLSVGARGDGDASAPSAEAAEHRAGDEPEPPPTHSPTALDHAEADGGGHKGTESPGAGADCPPCASGSGDTKPPSCAFVLIMPLLLQSPMSPRYQSIGVKPNCSADGAPAAVQRASAHGTLCARIRRRASQVEFVRTAALAILQRHGDGR